MTYLIQSMFRQSPNSSCFGLCSRPSREQSLEIKPSRKHQKKSLKNLHVWNRQDKVDENKQMIHPFRHQSRNQLRSPLETPSNCAVTATPFSSYCLLPNTRSSAQFSQLSASPVNQLKYPNVEIYFLNQTQLKENGSPIFCSSNQKYGSFIPSRPANSIPIKFNEVRIQPQTCIIRNNTVNFMDNLPCQQKKTNTLASTKCLFSKEQSKLESVSPQNYQEVREVKEVITSFLNSDREELVSIEQSENSQSRVLFSCRKLMENNMMLSGQNRNILFNFDS